MLLFLLLFVAAPLIELYFLIQVGSVIGALPTIALSVLTAVIGGALVRLQGVAVLMRVREMLERDEMPALEMLDGAVLLVCGFALLLPGFVTDAVGFLLLIPPLRHWLIRRYVHVVPVDAAARPRERGPRVIEGEFRRDDD
ncbi:MAG: FxsA family protein [Thiohalocapsa sp.]|nr:FxsA family protein [Thiohalocapsa sp.]MCF7991148.1 FxsA family protein [Thiohalocapsa sp.]